MFSQHVMILCDACKLAKVYSLDHNSVWAKAEKKGWTQFKLRGKNGEMGIAHHCQACAKAEAVKLKNSQHEP